MWRFSSSPCCASITWAPSRCMRATSSLAFAAVEIDQLLDDHRVVAHPLELVGAIGRAMRLIDSIDQRVRTRCSNGASAGGDLRPPVFDAVPSHGGDPLDVGAPPETLFLAEIDAV